MKARTVLFSGMALTLAGAAAARLLTKRRASAAPRTEVHLDIYIDDMRADLHRQRAAIDRIDPRTLAIARIVHALGEAAARRRERRAL